MKELPASEGESNRSPQRDRWRTSLGLDTRRLLERDEAAFFHQTLSTPCLDVLAQSQGALLHDVEGRSFLDLHGNSVHQLGYGHPAVQQAVSDAMKQLPFSPRRFTNPYAIELAERLIACVPGGGPRRLLFAPGGAEAIGMALETARAVTGRHKVLSLWDSFHGATKEAASVGGEALFRTNSGPLQPGVFHAPPPDPPNCPLRCGRVCDLRCADYLEYVLQKEGDVGAVLAETIRCTPVIPPKEWWTKVQAACRANGALLIIDEIPIGLGRTGRFFAFEHYDLDPDIVVLGKGLGGGVFPLAAMIGRAEFNDAIAHRAVGHFTHEKSSVGCAAGLATLRVIDEERLVERAAELGERMLCGLRALASRFDAITDVRGLGLMMGVEVGRRDAESRGLAERILYGCFARGLSFKITMGNILTLTPPLVLTDEQAGQVLAILENALVDALDPHPKGQSNATRW